MTAEQRIKRHLFLQAIQDFADDENKIVWTDEITTENIEYAWSILENLDAACDYLQEFRSSGEDSDLSSPYSRFYEAKEKALQLSDGTWVGWTYWYGGGKWGEPEAMDWLDKAYDLEVTQQTVVVNVFKKVE